MSCVVDVWLLIESCALGLPASSNIQSLKLGSADCPISYLSETA